MNYYDYDSQKSSRKRFGVFSVFILMIVAAVLGGLLVAGAISFGWIDLGIQSSISSEESGISTNNTYTITEEEAKEGNMAVSVAQVVSPAIVGIVSRGSYSDWYRGTQEVDLASGSGVIFDSDGYIITNNHVIEGASHILVNLYDGSQEEATLVGSDSRSDLAVLKIDATGLTAATFGDSDALLVGETVLAIGNPGGEEFARSVTKGIISGLNRQIVSSGGVLLGLVQTDAAINPGNSGGALVNTSGEVIGINSSKIYDTAYEGMGFAIPINTVKDIAQQLKENGRSVWPGLGVSILYNVDESFARYANLKVDYGVMVSPVSGSTAEKAGLKQYDIIIALNGEKIENNYDLQAAIYQYKVGDSVTVKVQREDKTLDFTVVLQNIGGE